MKEYNIDYLNSLIFNKTEESLHLEYKAAGALGKQNNKTDEISKDVSAMANSDGGQIIYGIKEIKTGVTSEIEINPVNSKDFSMEWIQNIINDKIQPRISGVVIFPITITDNETVYVIDIPKSDTAHQAADKRYYKRYNCISEAMHDYEIRDILNRSKNPKIDLKFKITNNTLDIYAVNNGPVYANYLKVIVRLSRISVDFRHVSKFNIINDEMLECVLSNSKKEMINPHSTLATFWPERYEPILPLTKMKLKNIELQKYFYDSENFIEWEIYCDNANPIFGKAFFKDILENKYI